MAAQPRGTQFQVRWYWKLDRSRQSSIDERWVTYSVIESEIIEKAFSNRDFTQLVELDHSWINLKDFIQISKHDENDRRQVKRDLIEKDDNEVPESHFLKPRSKPFNDSGLEGGIAFIYDWRKRNATLSNNEIVRQAINGITVEGEQLHRHIELKRLVQALEAVQNKSEREILQCCIYLYTLPSFLYSSMNRALRESDKSKIETFAPFCYFLTEAIWSDVLASDRLKSIVYRGIQLDPNSINHLEEAIGTYKCWYGLTSTSKNLQVAEIFGNVVFIIDISRTGGLELSLYASSVDEEEVILSPGTTFRIDEVERRDDKTYIYICIIPETRMVLLGRTGTGKSSLGNTILGRKQFRARKAAKSITTNCGAGDRIYKDRRLVVVDTPGFFDTELSPEKLIPEISGSYQTAAPGPDVFLVVLTFERFTPQEEAAAKWISEVFDERALDYCIIVFTGLDSLKRDEVTVEEYLQDAPVCLKKFIEKCKGRYIAVDNTASDDEKEETLKTLLNKISTMVQENGGQYYNNKQFIRIATVLDKYPGWFDPLKPDGTINLLPEIETIVTRELITTTIFNNQ